MVLGIHKEVNILDAANCPSEDKGTTELGQCEGKDTISVWTRFVFVTILSGNIMIFIVLTLANADCYIAGNCR